MKKLLSLLSLLATVQIASAQNAIPPAPDGQQTERVFTSVEQMPSFPGGSSAMMNYLNENIRYPKAAVQEGIEGSVIVRFVVTKEGTIRDVSVMKDIGSGCGEEAIRVVSVMPKWIPGKQNGAPVDVYYTLPVRFRLNSPNTAPASTSPNK